LIVFIGTFAWWLIRMITAFSFSLDSRSFSIPRPIRTMAGEDLLRLGDPTLLDPNAVGHGLKFSGSAGSEAFISFGSGAAATGRALS